MKNLLLVFCVLFFLILGCSNENKNNSADVNNRPVEEILVFLDTGKQPKPDDVAVKRNAYLLDYLAENTTSSRKEIADIAFKTTEIIKNKYGIEYKSQEILEGGKRIIDAIPENKRGKKDDFKMISYLLTLEASQK